MGDKGGPVCAYCGSQVAYTQDHHAVRVAGGWDVVAKEHAPGCRWIATKGYPGSDGRGDRLPGRDQEAREAVTDEKPNPKDFLHDTDPPVLVDDHQAVELIRDGDMLRRVIVCCDCGLVHLMSVNPESAKAYFVREDGPAAEALRQAGVEAGHRFGLLNKLADSEAARAKAEERAAQAEADREQAREFHRKEYERCVKAESSLIQIKEAGHLVAAELEHIAIQRDYPPEHLAFSLVAAYRRACEEGDRG